MTPNLFIIGAAKSGTTSLHHYLSRHAEVFMAHLKEPGFFVPEFRYHPKDPEWYLSLFADAGAVRYAGESSTHYTKLPYYRGVPERVHHFSPEARLIYIMRDPIDRAISHYWHNTRSIRPEFHEQRSMLQALTEDPLYMAYGDYAMQLRPWFELFGRNAVRTLVYEEVTRNPEIHLPPILEWLGLPPLPAGHTLERRNARPRTTTVPRGRGILHRVRYSKAWSIVSPLVPKAARKWARLRGEKEQLCRRTDMSEEVAEKLRPMAQDHLESTGALLGRDFPMWRTTLGIR